MDDGGSWLVDGGWLETELGGLVAVVEGLGEGGFLKRFNWPSFCEGVVEVFKSTWLHQQKRTRGTTLTTATSAT